METRAGRHVTTGERGMECAVWDDQKKICTSTCVYADAAMLNLLEAELASVQRMLAAEHERILRSFSNPELGSREATSMRQPGWLSWGHPDMSLDKPTAQPNAFAALGVPPEPPEEPQQEPYLEIETVPEDLIGQSRTQRTVCTVVTSIGPQESAGGDELLPIWSDNKARGSCLGIQGIVCREQQRDTMDFGNEFLSTPVAHGCCGRLMMPPDTLVRGFWDFASLLLVLYDLVVIPLQWFEFGEHKLLTLAEWITRLFWTCDIPMNFFTGYMKKDGTLEMAPPLVARRYVTTWFFLDVVIVTGDWLEVIFGATMRVFRAMRASKSLRLVRMVRLLRLLRIKKLVDHVLERYVRVEELMVVVQAFEFTLAVVAFAHIAGCAWYGIGSRDADITWVTHHELIAGVDQMDTLGYKYFTALAWALSQFGGGMDEVRPTNVGERIYANVCFIFAFVASVVFCSVVTGSICRLHINFAPKQQKLSVLRGFLYGRKVSSKLSQKVLRNAAQASKDLEERDIELLYYVSETLVIQLHVELHTKILQWHPFFAFIQEGCKNTFRMLCHHVASVVYFRTDEKVFCQGEVPTIPQMYIVVSGELFYQCSGTVGTTVVDEEWVAEMVLWMPWTHKGTLTAACKSSLCALSAKSFQEILSTQVGNPKLKPRKYAKIFARILNSQADITDLAMDREKEFVDMATKM